MRLKPFALAALAAILLSLCAGCSKSHHHASRNARRRQKQWEMKPA